MNRIDFVKSFEAIQYLKDILDGYGLRQSLFPAEQIA